jgi:2-dehydro-3-deoxyphosphogluconate aldolase/(4S)-4-hydroxy-2-oxoglutarate aldolase
LVVYKEVCMARKKRLDVLNRIVQVGLVPVFSHENPEVVVKVAMACNEGGCDLFEFTHRGDFPYSVFTEASRQLSKRCTLGVGSIEDPHTAAMYLAHDASFIVGPVLEPEVATICNTYKVSYSPGCGSATEIQQAHKSGVEIVKVFPAAQVGGPGFVSGILAPMPWTSMMPTGGVEPTEASLRGWFEAGVVAVGIGKKLFEKKSEDGKATINMVNTGDYAGITTKVAETLALINYIRDTREGK